MTEIPGHIQLCVHNNDYSQWAEVNIVPDSEGNLIAQTYMHGPGHGDAVMAMVQTALREQAELLELPITHEINASNKAAVALAERTPGYEHQGTSKAGNEIYTQTFWPK